MIKTLHFRLLAALSVLVIAPIITAGVMTIRQTYAVQERQAEKIQTELANRVGDELRNYVERHRSVLSQLIRVRGLIDLEPDQKEKLLSEALAFGNNFEELTLLDRDGREEARVHRYRIFVRADLGDRAGTDECTVPKNQLKVYYGPVHFHDDTGEPLMVVSVPILKVRDGSHQGALVGELRLKPIWDLLARIATDEGQAVYILDISGRVVAHPDPSVVLRNTRLSAEDRKPGLGLNGQEVIQAHKQVHFGGQRFTVVAEQSRTEALALTLITIRVVALLSGLLLLMVVVLIFLMMRQFIRPVEHLAAVAEAIESGDMSRQAEVTSNDEMGSLTMAFNRMTSRLKRSMDELEREVADREKAQKELKESEERYRTVVENAGEALVVTRDGRIEFYNPSAVALSGYPEDEFRSLAENLLDFIHPEDRPMLSQAMLRGQEGVGDLSSYDFRVLRKDGQLRYVSNSAVGIHWNGRPAALNFISDLTEQRLAEMEQERAEEQLRQAQKMEALGTLAGGIAHDFNNILSAIIGYSELALEDTRDGRSDPRPLREILKAGERAKDLVIQILTFSRKLEPETKPIDLNQVVLQTEGLLTRTIPRMIEIVPRLAEDLWLIQADPSQVSQVLMNLAGNAADAMPDGGRLVIETGNESLDRTEIDPKVETISGDYVRLEVRDTGFGMDPETLDHIFDPFFTRKEVGRGTGLGLSTVYGIVKNHSGYITCRSEKGKGTVFRIYFPAARLAAQIETEPGDDGEVVAGGRETILLVDDEDPIRSLAAELLGREGYRIMEAANGEEALEIFVSKGAAVDLVMLDISMPGMGGLRCFQELRRLDPDLRVVIVSGYSLSENTGVRGIADASAFIAKPFVRIDLLRTIRRVLDDGTASSGD